ncbi:Uncharacterised protein [Mycobacteroides abscessus subsp. abscessus]|nr:Uncharacterised protein [Mycobacteroides abscessus subsp. abscessus]
MSGGRIVRHGIGDDECLDVVLNRVGRGCGDSGKSVDADEDQLIPVGVVQDLQQIGAEELAVLPFGENGICRRGSQRVDDGSLGVVVGHAGTIELAKEPTLLFRHAAGLCRVVHRHLVCMRGVEQALDVL